MKLSKESLSKYTFWLSFLSGIPLLFDLVPFQSFNVSIFPALILLFKSSKVLHRDCFISLLFLIFYTFICFFSEGFSGYITLFELSSVILTYIALRSFRYFPSQKGITIYLIASVAIGLFQLSQGKMINNVYRGIPLLASEASRYARYLTVLILPIFIHWNSLKNKLGLPFLIFIFSFLLFFNRSASLVIPFLVLAFTVFLISINYLKRFLNTLKVNKYLLTFYGSVSLFLILAISFIARNFNVRIIHFVTDFFKAIFISGQFTSFLRFWGGRRLSTVIYSLQSGITRIIPNGVDSAKNILNYENLSNTYLGLSNHHRNVLIRKGSFESASFFSNFILDGGLIAFVLSILFTFTIFKYLKDSYFNLIFEEESSIYIRIESALRVSTCFIGILLLWFYSTNSILQPWLMIFIGLQPSYISNKKI